MSGVEIHGPRQVPARRESRGLPDEYLVIVKEPQRIVHHRFRDSDEADRFADEAREKVEQG
jgi:hypothetical protein